MVGCGFLGHCLFQALHLHGFPSAESQDLSAQSRSFGDQDSRLFTLWAINPLPFNP